MLRSDDAINQAERAARFDVRAEQEAEEEHAAAKRRAKRARRWGTLVLTAMLVSGTAVCLMGMRLIVLIVEAYTLISTERTAEDGFVQMCEQGSNRESVHMRQACMRATVDRASPILFGALTRGTYAFLRELYALVSLPFQAAGLVGVVSLLGVLPWLDAARRFIFPSGQTTPTPSAPEHTVFVLNTSDRAPPISLGGLRHMSNGLGYSSKPLLAPPAFCDGGFEDVTVTAAVPGDKWKVA